MPLPLLAIAARFATAQAGRALLGGYGDPPALSFQLAQNGRGIRRRTDRISKNARTAANRATRRVGMWVRTQIRRELTALLNIRLKDLKKKERQWMSGPSRARVYNLVYERWEFKVRQLKGFRFRPYANQKGATGTTQVGVLRIKAYGKRQVFRRVARRRGAGGDTFRFVATEAQRKAGRRFGRSIWGVYIKRDYQGPRGLKKQINKRWRAEFNRQIELLAAKS